VRKALHKQLAFLERNLRHALLHAKKYDGSLQRVGIAHLPPCHCDHPITQIQSCERNRVRYYAGSDGGFCAERLTESIFTQSDTWKEAVQTFYFDRPKPASIRLHLIRDEVLPPG